MNPLILCYSLSFFISLSFVIITVFVFHNKISIFYHLLFTTFAISSLGILQTANADNLQMAVFANQITYLGASFTPLLMLMSFADLCRSLQIPIEQNSTPCTDNSFNGYFCMYFHC